MMETKKIWQNADAVCFDVDSTVIQEEGIDELARFCKKSEEVTQLTLKAMSGSMTFQESLTLRLNIIKPTLADLNDFIRKCPPTLTPGVKTLINKLHKKSVPVFLISGGFQTIIEPIARQLEIPFENIYANKLIFTDGQYASFDKNQPTSASGGKAKVVELLKNKYGFKNLVLIGDGATDLEACPPADTFIGFGGNVVRESVKNNSKWFVTDFNELIECLD